MYATGRRKRRLKRTERSELPAVEVAKPELSRAQLRRRDAKIAQLWMEGATETVLAARFGMTEAAVREVAMRRLTFN